MSTFKEQSVFVILPNLKCINKNIYFILKRPVKIQKDGKTEFHEKILLNNLSLKGKLNYMDFDLKCTILHEEIDNGLKVNIKYISNDNIVSKQTIQKFCRAIESMILDIDIIEEEQESFEDDLYEEEHYSYNSNDEESLQDKEYALDSNETYVSFDDDYYY